MTATFEPALMPGILLSDGAIREMGTGKCTFIGSFQLYNLPQFPCGVPPFFVTAFVTNLGLEVKGLDITIRIENPQNSMVLASAAVKIDFGQHSPDRKYVYEIPVPIAGLTFPSAGVYTVVVLVNNEKLGERPLHVLAVQGTVKHE
jgi:hypothetical protein